MTLGETIRATRLVRSRTQSILAESAGVTARVIAAFESDAKRPDPDTVTALEKALLLPAGGLTADSAAFRAIAKPDQVLLEKLDGLSRTCSMDPYRALAAIDTVLLANKPSLTDPDGTVFIPPIEHDHPFGKYDKDDCRVRTIAAFAGLARNIISDKTRTLTAVLDHPMFDQYVNAAATLAGISTWPGDERVEAGQIARLYAAYERIGLTIATTYEEARDKIQAEMLRH